MTRKRIIWSCFGWTISVQVSYLVFVCCALLLCLLLSAWQWQRAQAADIRYNNYQQQESLPASVLSGSPKEYQRVSIAGEIKQYFLLDNQIHQGVAGWNVLAEVQTKQSLLLVNLGWHPKQSQLALQNQLPRTIKVQGLLKKPQLGFMLQAANDDPNWPHLLQQIDIPLLNKHFGYNLSPFVLYADSQVASLIPAPITMDNKFYKHFGYTIQWLLIAGACFIGFIYFCRQEHKENERKNESMVT